MKFVQIQSAQKILIYGYGLEGTATKSFLEKRCPNIQIDIFDNNISEYKTEQKLLDYDVLILSPAVPRELVKEVSTDRITSQTEIFFSNISENERRKIIGITATKGKSTTATFCSEMLERAGFKIALGGNIGKTFLDLIDDVMDNRYDFVVAELSSFQLEHLEISPGIAIFLNIFPEHLDHHKSFDRYFDAKNNLWKYQRFNDSLIAPEDSRHLIDSHCGGMFFAPPMPEERFPHGSIYRAQHFRQNLGTIEKLAQLLEIPENIVEETAQGFKGLPHRLEFFVTLKGIQFCNDSVATNMYATLAGIRTLGQSIGSIVLGGVDPHVNYEALIDGVLTYAPQARVIIMDTQIKEALLSAVKGRPLRCDVAADLSEVVQQALERTPENTICLFSPAAKSYDWFDNCYDRGERFKREVLQFQHEDSNP